jgi:membrane protein YdbS with pleckstrin-like domain
VTQVDSEPVLRAPAHRVSRRAIGYWTVTALVRWVILLAVGTGIYLASGRPQWLLVALIVVALLAVAHVLVMPRWRYAVHRWEATDDAVYTQAGWFNQERRIAPISRVQTVDSQRGPVEQLFRLANVTVTTASAAGPVRIHGLDLPVAQELVDKLTRRTQLSTGDAT